MFFKGDEVLVVEYVIVVWAAVVVVHVVTDVVVVDARGNVDKGVVDGILLEKVGDVCIICHVDNFKIKG